MSSDVRYRVTNSAAVSEQFRAIAEEARTTGRLPKLLAAARWIMEELARSPLEFGESWVTNARTGLVFRRGFAPPLHVQYAVHEAQRIVFIRRVVLLR